MNEYYPFVNTPLPYAYSALEPYIDEKTMKLHHDRHLQIYIDNLNNILKGYPELQKYSLTELVTSADNLSPNLRVPVKNNAGGVYNHRFFFDGMSNPSEKTNIEALSFAINKEFGSFDNFKAKFKAAALSVFGSGYAWLVLDNGQLKIITTANQDNPLAQGMCPIITLDVWEHGYYLKHYNVRADYIDDWFNIINWSKAEENYLYCRDIMIRPLEGFNLK